MSCQCTILDVRREQILEATGRLWVRLVCNVCGATLDTQLVAPRGDGEAPRPPPTHAREAIELEQRGAEL